MSDHHAHPELGGTRALAAAIALNIGITAADATLVALTGLGAAAGALLGSYLMTERLKSEQVKTLLGLVLIAVAVKMGWGLLP